MAVLKFKDENNQWQDLVAIRGRDGVIQYQAGNGITIEDNVISAIQQDLSNYYTKEQVNDLIDAIDRVKLEAVDELPETGEPGVIYLVPSADPQTVNAKDEYIYIDDAWEQIGTTAINLSNYLAKDNTTAYTPSNDYNPATKKYVDDGLNTKQVLINITSFPESLDVDFLYRVDTAFTHSGKTYSAGLYQVVNNDLELISRGGGAGTKIYYWDGTTSTTAKALFQSFIDDIAAGKDAVVASQYENATGDYSDNDIEGSYFYAFPFKNFDISTLPTYTGAIYIRANKGGKFQAKDSSGGYLMYNNYIKLVLRLNLTNGTVTSITNQGEKQYNWEEISNMYSKGMLDYGFENFAPKYNKNSTYDIGDIVVYADPNYKEGGTYANPCPLLYKCNTTISIAETFNRDHWTRINMLDVISQAGGGDMLKSVYDINNDGVVDNAEKVNNHTVLKDVPADAKFTDTTYSNATTSAAGLMSAADKTSLNGLVTAVGSVTSTDVSHWNTAYNNNHTHGNKSLLDTITAGDVSDWNGAVNNSHTHANKTVLDGITSANITAWNKTHIYSGTSTPGAGTGENGDIYVKYTA